MISENPEKIEKKKDEVHTSEKSRVKFIVTGTLVGSNLTRYN
jgi:hypothetical protein